MGDDVLGDVLRRLRLKSCVYFRHDFGAPFRMTIPDGPHAQFHHVVAGHCELAFDGHVHHLAPGDMALFPIGLPHELRAGSAAAAIPGTEAVAAIQDGQRPFPGPMAARVICGHFELDRDARHPMVGALPPLVVAPVADDTEAAGGRAVSELIMTEQAGSHTGSGAVVERLAEILLIRLLRRQVAEPGQVPGFAAALRDTRLARAVRFIHVNATRDIGLADLADASGMSRTVLAERFKDAIGMTPMAYLTHWRLLSARQLLAESNESVAEIAHLTGYGSDVALGRAFKRAFRQTPTAFRSVASR
jgi:AraC family transcriptional activator of mtrCDE